MQRPDATAAVQVLGNSTHPCSKNDLHFDLREARQLGMQTWRQHPQVKQQPVLVEGPADEGEAEMSASDSSDTERLHQDTDNCTLCMPPLLLPLSWSLLMQPHLTIAWWSSNMLLCTSMVLALICSKICLHRKR